MRQKIELFDYASEILKALPTGVLLTTQAGGRPNTMTIGWGTLGIEWGLPIFTVFVRESRYTRRLLDENPEFTINVPHGAVDRKILSFCGTKSGRDVDKFAALGLTPAEPEVIRVPGIRELPLTLECRVIYRQPQPEGLLPPAQLERFYPQDAGGARDLHVAYYGQVVSAYLLD